eukprot:m.492014 g.492014  ORF g.492014 m.492014 type:complete len:172 (-) comp31306_c0_seq1:92-607(-)
MLFSTAMKLGAMALFAAGCCALICWSLFRSTFGDASHETLGGGFGLMVTVWLFDWIGAAVIWYSETNGSETSSSGSATSSSQPAQPRPLHRVTSATLLPSELIRPPPEAPPSAHGSDTEAAPPAYDELFRNKNPGASAAPRFCRSCGKPMDADNNTKFCKYCGQPVDTSHA